MTNMCHEGDFWEVLPRLPKTKADCKSKGSFETSANMLYTDEASCSRVGTGQCFYQDKFKLCQSAFSHNACNRIAHVQLELARIQVFGLSKYFNGDVFLQIALQRAASQCFDL